MSWLSQMFRPPNFQTVDTDRFYGMADQMRDPHSGMNRQMFGQMQRMGTAQAGAHGLQAQRMGAMGRNPFADQQMTAQRRQIGDQTLQHYGQYMHGQHQQAAGYDQMGMQGEQFNRQLQAMGQMQARANRGQALGMGIGALAGITPDVSSWLAKLIGGEGEAQPFTQSPNWQLHNQGSNRLNMQPGYDFSWRW